jgi:hypothetical protein
MDELARFYEDLKQGISVEDFLQRYPQVIKFVHQAGLTSDMRLARGRVKRLCDEVSPARHFAKAVLHDSDLIQFPLNTGPFDCSVLSTTGSLSRIQITVAQARERFNLMTELDSTGEGRGYLGVTDDMPTDAFRRAMERGRVMYSTEAAKKTLCEAVSLCVENKNGTGGADTLLIQAPLEILPERRVAEIFPALVNNAACSVFSSVYVVGGGESNGQCIRLK